MGRVVSIVSLILLMSFIAGCGETVNGVVKDTKRIGAGVKKIFVREG